MHKSFTDILANEILYYIRHYYASRHANQKLFRLSQGQISPGAGEAGANGVVQQAAGH